MNAKQNIKGFTIIEVVLVLAIAGLIFLMVFIALPALQAGQRDTARKSDVSVVAAAVNSYASGAKGDFPGDSDTLQGYISNVSGNTVKTQITIDVRPSNNRVQIADTQIKVVKAAKCGDPVKMDAATKIASTPVVPGTARQYATITLLEGGNGTSFCQDS